MTWERAKFAAALADTLTAATSSLEAPPSVFASPPMTLNAPALVVGRPSEVVYATGGLGIDVATIPVVCLANQLGEDAVDALIGFVRGVVAANDQLGGVVQIMTAPRESNWRAVNVAGVDMLAADVILTVQM